MRLENLEDFYPLTPMQEGMLFHTISAPETGIYVIQQSCTLNGDLNVHAFKQAWQKVLSRHPVLRTYFVWEGVKRPVQAVQRQVDLPFTEYDWRADDPAERKTRLARLLDSERQRDFSLSEPPLMRLALVRVTDGAWHFIWTYHHLLLDGWSESLVIKEVFSCYEVLNRGQRIDLELPRPYRDYIVWQQQQDITRAEAFWRRTLKGFTEPTPIKIAAAAEIPATGGASHTVTGGILSSQLTETLQAFARQHQLLLNTLVQGAWALVLSRHSGRDDVLFGTVVSGRPPELKRVESMVGLFINTLPVRVKVAREAALVPWLRQFQAHQVEARQYEYTPLMHVQKWSDVPKGSPLFESLLAFENHPIEVSAQERSLSLAVQRLSQSDQETAPPTNYPLTIAALPGQELTLGFTYDRRRFAAAFIKRLVEDLKTLLGKMVVDAEQTLGALLAAINVAAAPPEDEPDASEFDQLYAKSNLTRSQLAFWLGQKVRPDEPLHNMAALLSVSGDIAPHHFRKAVKVLVNSSDALRTVIDEIAGVPQQRIMEDFPFEPEFVDLSQHPDALTRLEDWAKNRCQASFNLSRCLFDAALVKVADREYAFYIGFHQTISDAVSGTWIYRRSLDYYELSLRGELPDKVDLPPFQNFLQFERDYCSSPRYEKNRAYWQRKLANGLEPIDYYGKSPGNQVSHIRRLACDFGAERTRQLLALASQEEVSVGIPHLTYLNIFLALMFTYFYRLTGKRDIAIGMPVHNRRSRAFKETIGFFAHIFPVRVTIDTDESFLSLIKKLAAENFEILEHSEHYVKGSFQKQTHYAMLNYNHMYEDSSSLIPLKEVAIKNVEWLNSGYGDETFTVQIYRFIEGNFTALFDLDSEVFSEAKQQEAMSHLLNLADALLAAPLRPLAEISLLSPTQRQLLLAAGRGPALIGTAPLSLAQLIRQQALAAPDRIALGADDDALTYCALDRQSNAAALRLRAAGAGPEQLVCFYAQRSTAFFTAMLGVFKAGAAYLPLDPQQPARRIRHILEQSAAQFILVDAGLHARLQEVLADWPGSPPQVLHLDELVAGGSARPPALDDLPHALSYIFYTSGSTGAPKGAMVEQEGCRNHVLAKLADFGLSAEDVVAQNAAASFDVSVWQVLAPLVAGGRVEIASDELARDGQQLLRWLDERGVTVLEVVPTQLRALLEGLRLGEKPKLERLRVVFVMGEVLSPGLCQQWQREYGEAELINGYGTTESSDDVTQGRVRKGEWGEGERVRVGRVLGNMRVVVGDEWQEVVADGVIGEIYIGGVSVGRGYMKDAERTAVAYEPDGNSERGGERVYRTGDVGRWVGGELDFLGRRDQQVKVRGYRIELGEIESVLRGHAGVREAVVEVRQRGGREGVLVGYVERAGVEEWSYKQMQRYLKERLPDYMVPSEMVVVEKLPVGRSGKVDREKVKELGSEQGGVGEEERREAYEGPRTALEEVLVGIWGEVLGRERVGIHDNFFELGGDSILSLRIVAQANQSGLSLTPMHVFQHQTIAELSAFAEANAGQADQAMNRGPLPLMPAQEWFFAQQPSDAHNFAQAIIVELSHRVDSFLLNNALEHLLVHHEAFSLRLVPGESSWQQILADTKTGEVFLFTEEDLSALPADQQNETLGQALASQQSGLNLWRGPLVRVTRFNLGADHPGYLLIAAHQLVIDGISLRILLEDLQTIYGQLEAGQAAQLSSKTASITQWTQRLAEYGQSEPVRRDLSAWLADQQIQSNGWSPVLFGDLGMEPGRLETLAVSLSEEETNLLLQAVPAAYKTRTNEVLTTALAQVLAEWSGSRTVLIDLGVSRPEKLFEDMDFSRTVGPGSIFFPALLTVEGGSNPGEALKSIKEQLRPILSRGIGYGLPRLLNAEPGWIERMPALAHAEVSFNYLGEFDEALGNNSLFKPARGLARSISRTGQVRPYKLEANAFISSGRLQINWSYALGALERTGAERLAQDFLKTLRALIDHCRSGEARGFTPSDFPTARVNQKNLDDLIARISQTEAEQSV